MDIPDDLPVPSTSRNLQPRSRAASSACSRAQSTSDSRPSSRSSASRISGSQSMGLEETSSTKLRNETGFIEAGVSSTYKLTHLVDDPPHSQSSHNTSLNSYSQSSSNIYDGGCITFPIAQDESANPKKRKRSDDLKLLEFSQPYRTNNWQNDSDAEVHRELLNEDNSSSEHASLQENSKIDRKGKGKARAQTPNPELTIELSDSSREFNKSELEPLSAYTCPICFCPPTNATLTPCGHISCGACLFAAVKTTLQRAAVMGPALNEARCPVCRATIPGWDGKGGGVIGLKPRAIFHL